MSLDTYRRLFNGNRLLRNQIRRWMLIYPRRKLINAEPVRSHQLGHLEIPLTYSKMSDFPWNSHRSNDRLLREINYADRAGVSTTWNFNPLVISHRWFAVSTCRWFVPAETFNTKPNRWRIMADTAIIGLDYLFLIFISNSFSCKTSFQGSHFF